MGDQRAAAGVGNLANWTVQPLGTEESVWPMKRGGQ
jgi:hypothetical protein